MVKTSVWVIVAVVCLFSSLVLGDVDSDYQDLIRGKKVKIKRKLLAHIMEVACCSTDAHDRFQALYTLQEAKEKGRLDKFGEEEAEILAANLRKQKEGDQLSRTKIIELIAPFAKDSKKVRQALIYTFDNDPVRYVHFEAGKALLESFPKKFYNLKVEDEKNEDIRLFQLIIRDLNKGGDISARRNILKLLRLSKFDFDDLPDALRYELENQLLLAAQDNEMNFHVQELLRAKWEVSDKKSLGRVMQELEHATNNNHGKFLLMLVDDYDYAKKTDVHVLEEHVMKIKDDYIRGQVIDLILNAKDRCRKPRHKLSH